MIEIGQEVYCPQHWAGSGVVTAVHGQQQPETVQSLAGMMVTGGSATFDVAFDSGYHSRQVPEGIVLAGGGWRVYPRIHTAAEVAAAVTVCEQAQAKRDRAAREEHESHLSAVASRPAEYPYLELLDASPKSKHALGAANLRRHLKREFPGTKFSVSSTSYSGGSSIDIGWRDGPLQAAVKDIGDLYGTRNFDGMQDLETIRRNAHSDVFGGASYVFAQRSYSPEFLRQCCEAVGEDPALVEVSTYSGEGHVNRADYEVSRRILEHATHAVA